LKNPTIALAAIFLTVTGVRAVVTQNKGASVVEKIFTRVKE